MKSNDPTQNSRFYGSGTVGSKGQIVIPAEARKELNFHDGDKVVIVRAPFGEGIVVIKAGLFEEMVGRMQSHLTDVADSLKNIKDKK